MHRLMTCTSQPCARVLGRGREAVQGMWKSALQHQESPRACSPASWAVGSAVTGVRSGGWGESGHGAPLAGQSVGQWGLGAGWPCCSLQYSSNVLSSQLLQLLNGVSSFDPGTLIYSDVLIY